MSPVAPRWGLAPWRMYTQGGAPGGALRAPPCRSAPGFRLSARWAVPARRRRGPRRYRPRRTPLRCADHLAGKMWIKPRGPASFCFFLSLSFIHSISVIPSNISFFARSFVSMPPPPEENAPHSRRPPGPDHCRRWGRLAHEPRCTGVQSEIVCLPGRSIYNRKS